MQRKHEKSHFAYMMAREIEEVDGVIIQIEQCSRTEPGWHRMVIAEVVNQEDYNRTTAEGRAAEAEKSLQEEIEAHKIEMEEAEAKIEALEELLAEAKDAREGMRKGVAEVQKENGALYEALVECRRIFGELPKEIEDLIAKGEDGKCIL